MTNASVQHVSCHMYLPCSAMCLLALLPRLRRSQVLPKLAMSDEGRVLTLRGRVACEIDTAHNKHDALRCLPMPVSCGTPAQSFSAASRHDCFLRHHCMILQHSRVVCKIHTADNEGQLSFLTVILADLQKWLCRSQVLWKLGMTHEEDLVAVKGNAACEIHTAEEKDHCAVLALNPPTIKHDCAC